MKFNLKREFIKCQDCDAVFVNPKDYISLDEESKRYRFHENSSDDPDYQAYHQKFMNQLITFIQEPMIGIDFGSGATSVLAALFNQAGHDVVSYDHEFFPDEELLKKSYQLILMSEVWEHIKQPKQILEWVQHSLLDNGIWALRTSLRVADDQFENWYYKNDPTHVLFCSSQTWLWIAREYHWKILKLESPFIILQKSH